MKRFLLALSVIAAAAQARSLEIEDFKAEITVSADGSVTVTETLRVAFLGSWNGIFRHIPYRYVQASGLRTTLDLEIDAVTDEKGKDLWHEISREEGSLRVKIAVPNAKNAKRTVVIRYRSRNVIRRYGDVEGYGEHDEIYWNVTGNEWPFPIRRASAIVTLPPGVPAEEVRVIGYTGPAGSRGQAFRSERLEGGRVLVETTESLKENEGLTIAVGFPVGHVRYPTWREEAWWLFEANWGAVLPLCVGLLWVFLWWFRGRDPLKGATIIPEFEPPFGLRPSQVGVIADEVAEPRDVTACILDLAVRGHLEIDMRKSRAAFRRKETPRDPAPLLPYEEKILEGLFKKGESVGSARPGRLGKRMEKIREALYDDVAKGGYFRARPDEVRTTWGCSGALLLVVAAVAGFFWATWWVVLLAVIPVGFVIEKCTRQMPRRTRRGLEALRRIRGMTEYLETAEKERLSKMPREHFEELLPYAVVLGVHDRWTEVFEQLFEVPPDWFVGRANDDFSTGTDRFVRSTREATEYTPRSSSGGGGGGSGFGGGGSSGGGSGGGGGGGW